MIKNKERKDDENNGESFIENYQRLTKEFIDALTNNDEYKLKIIRRSCVEEYIYNKKWSDDEKNMFMILAWYCNSIIEHHVNKQDVKQEIFNEFSEYLSDETLGDKNNGNNDI
ncbi:hypothetical protein J7J90_01970 [Candidatus Micrarchaeota archaeon]|nr:hypothetical protein [Candidatus Micrarchaeota archaeon]